MQCTVYQEMTNAFQRDFRDISFSDPGRAEQLGALARNEGRGLLTPPWSSSIWAQEILFHQRIKRMISALLNLAHFCRMIKYIDSCQQFYHLQSRKTSTLFPCAWLWPEARPCLGQIFYRIRILKPGGKWHTFNGRLHVPLADGRPK